MLMRNAVGDAPGTLYFNPAAPISEIQVIAYGPSGIDEQRVFSIPDLRLLLMKWPIVWINVNGIDDGTTLQEIGNLFQLHPLALEDVQNVTQRPKVDVYDDHLFIIARTVDSAQELEIDQMSMFVGDNYVITFQQRSGDPLDPVRRRLRMGSGQIRDMGSGYLAYAILDAIIDHYFPLLERYGDELEHLEDAVALNPHPSVLAEVYRAKRELFNLRKATWPMRDVINTLARDECRFIKQDTRVYLRDCYDHIVQILDLVETNRELCSALMEFYLSSQSTRMNEVMKVLTIISTVFIPLTFIAGIYGMNFDSMWELHVAWGYPAAMVAMAVIAAVELWFFYRKGWLGSSVNVHPHLQRGSDSPRRPEPAGKSVTLPPRDTPSMSIPLPAAHTEAS